MAQDFPYNIPSTMTFGRIIFIGYPTSTSDKYYFAINSLYDMYVGILMSGSSTVSWRAIPKFGNSRMIEATLTTDSDEASWGARPIGFTVTTNDNIQYLLQAQNNGISFLRRTWNTNTSSWNTWAIVHHVNWTS